MPGPDLPTLSSRRYGINPAGTAGRRYGRAMTDYEGQGAHGLAERLGTRLLVQS
jgi:hypothetical protein